VMELVSGSTLADRLRYGPMPVEEVVRIGRQVAEALALVHEREIVHRDIKPANILTTPHDREPMVKVADFGIARLSGETRLTMTGVTIGTVRYLSPEQVTGSSLGPASDVYSLGLVLIECLAGRAPFAGTLSESAAARLTSSPPIPDGVPPELRRLIEDMTAREPEARPAAARVAERLAGLEATTGEARMAAETEAITVPATLVAPSRAEATEPGHRRTRLRRPALWGAAGVVAVLVVGGSIVAAQDDTSTPQPGPSYPAVQGELGDALTTLQESVVP